MTEILTHSQDISINTNVSSSTGILNNIEITYITNKVTIPDFEGYIYNNNSSTKVEFKSKTFTPLFLNEHESTYILVDRNGQLLSSDTEPSIQMQVDYIYLCQIMHPDMQIVSIVLSYNLIRSGGAYFNELINYITAIVKGCKIIKRPNTTFLQLTQKAGSVYYKNINMGVSPSNIIYINDHEIEFIYILSNSRRNNITQNLDPNTYEENGITTDVTIGYYTLQRLGMTYDKEYLIQYGYKQYSSINDAINDLNDIVSVFPMEIEMSKGIIFAYILMKQGITNNNDIMIISTNNFCDLDSSMTYVNTQTATGSLLSANNLEDVDDVDISLSNLGIDTKFPRLINDKIPNNFLPDPRTERFRMMQFVEVTSYDTGALSEFDNNPYQFILFMPLSFEDITEFTHLSIFFHPVFANIPLGQESNTGVQYKILDGDNVDVLFLQDTVMYNTTEEIYSLLEIPIDTNSMMDKYGVNNVTLLPANFTLSFLLRNTIEVMKTRIFGITVNFSRHSLL